MVFQKIEATFFFFLNLTTHNFVTPGLPVQNRAYDPENAKY